MENAIKGEIKDRATYVGQPFPTSNAPQQLNTGGLLQVDNLAATMFIATWRDGAAQWLGAVRQFAVQGQTSLPFLPSGHAAQHM